MFIVKKQEVLVKCFSIIKQILTSHSSSPELTRITTSLKRLHNSSNIWALLFSQFNKYINPYFFYVYNFFFMFINIL